MGSKRRVLLIGWDAADWKIIHPLLDRGEMPRLKHLLEEGVMGYLRTLHPVLSPLLWNSIATGVQPDRHGVLGFTEVDEAQGTVRPSSVLSRKVKAVWNILQQNGYRVNVLNWYATHPAEPLNGVCVSDLYTRPASGPGASMSLSPGTVYPHEQASALGDLRVRPDQVPEWMLKLFVPRAAEVDQERDPTLARLAMLLSECLSVHRCAAHVISHTEWDFTAVYYPSIDHFCHGFMRFHPPRMDDVPEDAFALYRDVVNGAYRLHDVMLKELLQLAGEDTTVIILSDHGFHSDHLRPTLLPPVATGPAEQHRHLGILAMRGAGLKRDEIIHGAGLLDIAPTLLSLYGLPAGRDMPGRVLTGAFERQPSLARIPSWEEVEGTCGRHPPGTVMSLPPDDSALLLEQFAALGYIDPQEESQQRNIENTRREADWNLARIYSNTGRHGLALPLLEDLHGQWPDRPDISVALIEACCRLGMIKDAGEISEQLTERRPELPVARYLQGIVELERERFEEGLEHLHAAEAAYPRLPWLHIRIGYAFYKLGRMDDGGRAFEKAAEIDPHEPIAHMGIAGCAYRRGEYRNAVESALEAVGYQHDLPLAHLILGCALQELGLWKEAIGAFEVCLSLRSNQTVAHRHLAGLYSEEANDEARGMKHRDAMVSIIFQRRQARKQKQGFVSDIQKRLEQRARRTLSSAERRQTTEEPQTAEEQPQEEIIVVSGLPRSGTSLMMQMLGAAGVPLLTDNKRQADESNPKGYFEWEPIKKIGRCPELMKEAQGKAVKIVSALLPRLPKSNRYRLLFMDRSVEEVVPSQLRMLERLGRPKPLLHLERLEALLEKHRQQIVERLQSHPMFSMLVVDYVSLVHQPEEWLPRIMEFLGPERLAHPERMGEAIRPVLHRERVDG